MNHIARVAVLFWWFALLGLDGSVIQHQERFLTRYDCDEARTIYELIVEALEREDMTVGRCVEAEG